MSFRIPPNGVGGDGPPLQFASPKPEENISINVIIEANKVLPSLLNGVEIDSLVVRQVDGTEQNPNPDPTLNGGYVDQSLDIVLGTTFGGSPMNFRGVYAMGGSISVNIATSYAALKAALASGDTAELQTWFNSVTDGTANANFSNFLEAILANAVQVVMSNAAGKLP